MFVVLVDVYDMSIIFALMALLVTRLLTTITSRYALTVLLVVLANVWVLWLVCSAVPVDIQHTLALSKTVTVGNKHLL